MSKKHRKNKHHAVHEPAEMRDPVCGRVKIDFNQENEIKTALTVEPGCDDADVIAEALWRAYVAEKTGEWARSFDQHAITRASGKRVVPPLHAEDKPYRRRFFQTVATGHPSDVEIRLEDLTMMIKLAQHRVGSPVLQRLEVRVRQQLPGQIALGSIPGKTGRYLAQHFNNTQPRYTGVMTESFRRKITVPIRYQWKKHALVVEYERAMDIGVSRSVAGHRRDLTEFEGEVKKIFNFEDYMRGTKVDLKATPDYAGFSLKEINHISTKFLREHLDNFLTYANAWLKANGYGHSQIVTVNHSKSHPEMEALHAILRHGDRAARRAFMEAPPVDGGFAVNNALNALRLEMAGQP